MFTIVRALLERFRTLFVTHAILELEADLIAAGAERTAELLRRADLYEKSGLPGVARQLREQTESLSTQKPLASVLPIVVHLQVDQAESSKIAESNPLPDSNSAEPSLPMARDKSPIAIEVDHALARHFRTVLGPLERSRANRFRRFGPHYRRARVTLSRKAATTCP